MARLLRSTATYKLRPPVVVSPPAVPFLARRIQVAYLIAGLRAVERHPINSTLWPPQVIDPLPPTFGPLVTLVQPSRQSRRAVSRLRPPISVGAVVFRPIRVYRTRPSRPPPVKSHLLPPTVLGVVAATFMAPPLRLWRVLARKPPKTQAELRVPAVAGNAIIFRPLEVKLAQAPRPRPVKSKLSAPAPLVSVVAGFIALPLRVRLAVAPRPRAVKSKLSSPATLASVAAGFIALPLRLRLAVSPSPRPVKSELRPPVALAPAVVFAAIKTKLIPSPTQARASHSRLNKPAVVASLVFGPLKVFRTRPHGPPKTQADLRPPTILAIPAAIVAAVVALFDRRDTDVAATDANVASTSAVEATGTAVSVTDTADTQAGAQDGSGADVQIQDIQP